MAEGSLAKSETFLAPGCFLVRDIQPPVCRGTVPGSLLRGSADSMAIVDTVWGRLARFNPPNRRHSRDDGGKRILESAAAALRGLGLVGVGLLVGFSALAGALWTVGLWLGGIFLRLLYELGLFVWFRLLPALGRLALRTASFCWWRLPGLLVAFRRVILALCLVLAGWAAVSEMRTSHLQALLFSRLDRGMKVAVRPGPDRSIEFPRSGPYDERLGYSALPDFISALTAHRYAVDSQARWSPGMARFVGLGTFPIFPEKDKAGLKIYDRTGDRIYGVQFPERTYSNYASIPQLVVNSLSFIEDRYLFDPRYPDRNPAVEWKRFALAAAGRIGRLVVPHLHEGGGSTLATQIEKFRHSPHGLTGGAGEKLRQMLTASARAYMDGPDTLQRREQIMTTYLNATPLASMPG